MDGIACSTDRRLLDDWQRDFPVTARPFALLGEALGIGEDEVIARLSFMQGAGRVSRLGATIAPNTISASTLAAVAAPPNRIEEVAALIGTQPGVNHNYQREDFWNLWFVATGPDRAHVDETLACIEKATGLRVLDLRLVRPFNVDLGFRMNGPRQLNPPRPADRSVLLDGDRDLLQILARGMPLAKRPYAEIGLQLGLGEAVVIDRINVLQQAGIISRLGVIVRHRALGWSANAMVVWDLPQAQIGTAGPALAALDGVTLAYERRPVPGVWPYRLYNMVHARTRSGAQTVIDAASALPELAGARTKVLFSSRCFKQTGALIARSDGRAA
ncbi:siroheme decarboxylase subunit beta [Leisingera sp. McT4-56]|uniref:siroheme decarboxylase subunit beta n=1 Tax=Leisingera sp. McT4-56 TaxID=2881255 RepID=UPI001CF863D7|nr:Lrp/AsnC family transcriptional regulator [Leisingera sp. McT4-56]MCB4456310.1 Lrp/AsnC family transcriptional regulator [Leisingera sp. McT4-56]